MKKGILFISTIFICVVTYAQRYETVISTTVNATNFVNDPNTLIGEEIIFLGYGPLVNNGICSPSSGQMGTLTSYDICGSNLNFPGAPFFNSVNVMSSIITDTNIYENGITGRLDAHTSFTLKPGLQQAGSNLFSVNYSNTINNFQYCTLYTASDTNTGFSSVSIRVAELGKNLYNLNPQYQIDNSIACGDNIEIETNACGIQIHYALEYQIRNSGGIVQSWSEALSYNYQSAPSLNILDFPNLQEGQILDIRLRYSENSSIDTNDYSDILIFEFISCSPQITNFTSTDTSCSYSSDGGFTVTFDRPLDNGEELSNLSLHWAGLDDILDTADDVPAFDGISTANYTGTTFTWPNPIPAGTYRFLYQSGNANSDESYEPIIINAPPPIVFSATKNDILCFNDGNGEIEIIVDEAGLGNIGTPPYYYSLNGPPLVPFISGNTHTITGLPAGNYALKVFDNANCTEQEQE